jgi:K+-transporting ATPase ATPase C chain
MKKPLYRDAVVALRVSLVTMVLTGLAYPLIVTGLAQTLFHHNANGSLVPSDRGTSLGSEHIGQSFANPRYLQPRPSAAGGGYDANASSGSNLAPSSPQLKERATAEAQRQMRENPGATRPVPLELLTTSASGLDPHLSPDAALWQAERIAAARGVSPERVRAVLNEQVEPRTLGFLGEPRVNVLLTNLALDRQLGTTSN